MRTAQATLLVTVKETMFSLLRLINDLRLKLPRYKRSDGRPSWCLKLPLWSLLLLH